jgi:8-oxo-dGTP diphosphatase
MNQPLKPGVDYIGISTPFFCNDGKGQFLLHKRSKNCRDEHGRWDPGGGKLEFGITPEENVLREVREEYGCDGEIQEPVPPHSLVREWEGQRTHWLSIPFFVKVDPQKVRNNEPENIDELGWFPLHALPSPLHTGFARTLSQFPHLFEKYARL